jgi:hypothetical protein
VPIVWRALSLSLSLSLCVYSTLRRADSEVSRVVYCIVALVIFPFVFLDPPSNENKLNVNSVLW